MDNDMKKLEELKRDKKAIKAQLSQLEKKDKSQHLDTILDLKDNLRQLDEEISEKMINVKLITILITAISCLIILKN